jgi:ribosomal protein S18 acetylase RimI-like enzyme
MRQRGVGRLALNKLAEFVQMLGVSSEIEARVSTSNLRAQRFLEACGFRKFEQRMSFEQPTNLGTAHAQSQCGEDSRASVANLHALHFVKTLGEYAS